jgi:hypothetical protein
MTHKYPSEKFTRWAEDLGISNIINVDVQTIKKELRAAQKLLNEIEQQADALRTEHLRSQLTQAELEGDQKLQERRLHILIRAHGQKQHFKRLKQIFNQNKSVGLSYILVPEKFAPEEFLYDPDKITTWEPIHDHEQVQQCIQHRNLIHFGKAQGTPLTILPLD